MGYHLPYAYGAPLTYTAAAAPVVTYTHAPVVYTAAAGCQNEAGAVVPCAHGGVVPFGVPVAAAPAAAAEPAVEEAGKKRLKPKLIQKPRPKPGFSTALT